MSGLRVFWSAKPQRVHISNGACTHSEDIAEDAADAAQADRDTSYITMAVPSSVRKWSKMRGIRAISRRANDKREGSKPGSLDFSRLASELTLDPLGIGFGACERQRTVCAHAMDSIVLC